MQWAEITTCVCTLRNELTQVVEALRKNPKGRGFEFPMMSLEFLFDTILLAALWLWGRFCL
jgi:hypothetical protein